MSGGSLDKVVAKLDQIMGRPSWTWNLEQVVTQMWSMSVSGEKIKSCHPCKACWLAGLGWTPALHYHTSGWSVNISTTAQHWKGRCGIERQWDSTHATKLLFKLYFKIKLTTNRTSWMFGPLDQLEHLELLQVLLTKFPSRPYGWVQTAQCKNCTNT